MYSNNYNNFSTLKEEHKELLPGLTSPYEGELLSSWLYRLAQRHDIKVHVFIKYLFYQIPFCNRDIDLYPNDKIIEILSNKTLCSDKKIMKSFVMSYFEMFKERENIKQWILLSNKQVEKTGKRLMYCPSCLSRDGNNPYFRRQWRLSFNICCIQCKVYLLDCCPKCKEPIQFFLNHKGKNVDIDRKLSICHKCNFNLIKAPRKKVTPAIIAIQKKLDDVLNSKYAVQYFKLLYFIIDNTILPQGKKLKFLYQKLYKKFYLPIEKNSTHKFNCLDIKSRKSIIVYAVFILEIVNQKLQLFPVYMNSIKLASNTENIFDTLPFSYWKIVFNFSFKYIGIYDS